ncbi:MAG: hypothetical protein K9L17_01310 [Clostridiales bacterium]|nr:hypothetical protein [Clostridiales bacterium]MCF8021329.1 hypothetical protein [Clostridiales bacterium]
MANKIDLLIEEIEKMDFEEQRELFNRLADTLDLLGWVNFFDIKIK